jgi:hypothetical protein
VQAWRLTASIIQQAQMGCLCAWLRSGGDELQSLYAPCRRSRRPAATGCRPRGRTPARPVLVRMRWTPSNDLMHHGTLRLHAGHSGDSRSVTHLAHPIGTRRRCLSAGNGVGMHLDVVQGDDWLHADRLLVPIARWPPGPAARLQRCIIRVQRWHAPAATRNMPVLYTGAVYRGHSRPASQSRVE